MKDKVFIDSNIFIYAFLEGTENNEKRLKTIQFLQSLEDKTIVVSTQVLGEIYNTLNHKYKIKREDVIKKLDILSETALVKPLTIDTVKKCWDITLKHNYSYYDSLILASAIEHGCSFIYTEDMKNEHIVENSKILNPYI
ncbi:MAG: hypothetical protein A2287_08395 [Candidatus Melainabacteria bacterium RIFOXYA12_FULL_32_12]|nr:MAG: hypothetical protein A2287_08395 [Candidatus Melainabacteria bacterium RIFOXYA12_FULL_32_12]